LSVGFREEQAQKSVRDGNFPPSEEFEGVTFSS